MSLQMGGAHIDEHGNITGGSAGDQTGSEVCRRDWYVYSKGWSFIAFHPDADVREKHAQAVEQACDNDNVGYDQIIAENDGRNTLYKQAKLVDWIIKNIKTKCECDCSSLQDVAAICSGGVDASAYGSNGPATGEMRSWLKAAGYVIITASKYLSNSIYSLRGAIYVSEGHHTECALGNGSNYQDILNAGGVSSSGISSSGEKGYAESYDESIAGKYTVTASSLNIRSGAGTGYNVLTTASKGSTVQNYGYYSTVNGVKWLYVAVGNVTGFADSEYLSKSGSSSSSSPTSSSLPTYTVGKTYTVQADHLAVRSGAGTSYAQKSYSQLTSNAKANAHSDGCLKKGTKVTCQATRTNSGEVWMQIPSGWVAAYYGGKKYVS